MGGSARHRNKHIYQHMLDPSCDCPTMSLYTGIVSSLTGGPRRKHGARKSPLKEPVARLNTH
eukprot:4767493-Lingulodinium_polyedra.AAC.1